MNLVWSFRIFAQLLDYMILHYNNVEHLAKFAPKDGLLLKLNVTNYEIACMYKKRLRLMMTIDNLLQTCVGVFLIFESVFLFFKLIV